MASPYKCRFETPVIPEEDELDFADVPDNQKVLLRYGRLKSVQFQANTKERKIIKDASYDVVVNRKFADNASEAGVVAVWATEFRHLLQGSGVQ
ncbi:hypothetical protein BGZ65_007759, partial [Modicella reniformis]